MPTDRIRVARPGDADAIRRVYKPWIESTAITFEGSVPSAGTIRKRIDTQIDDYPWLVAISDDRIIGFTTADQLRDLPPYTWTVELSIYIEADYHRAGIGTMLYDALLATLTKQGFMQAYAITTLPNPASTNFHREYGFSKLAEFPNVGYTKDDWHDIAWWCRQLNDPSPDPAPPIPFAELRADDAVPVES